MKKEILEKYLLNQKSIPKSKKDDDKFKLKVASHRYIIIKRFENGKIIDQIFDKENNVYVEDAIAFEKEIKSAGKMESTQITIDEIIAEQEKEFKKVIAEKEKKIKDAEKKIKDAEEKQAALLQNIKKLQKKNKGGK